MLPRGNPAGSWLTKNISPTGTAYLSFPSRTFYWRAIAHHIISESGQKRWPSISFWHMQGAQKVAEIRWMGLLLHSRCTQAARRIQMWRMLAGHE